MNTFRTCYHNAKTYFTYTCVIFTVTCAAYYGYGLFTGKGLSFAVPITMYVQHLDGIDVATASLGVSISQADGKAMGRIDAAAKPRGGK